jgi:lipoprotein-releasing system permease protein
LNTAFEIAKRISFQKQKTYTRFIVRLSMGATAISVAAIILTFSIVNGFQEIISNKVYSFWGHVRIGAVSKPVMDRSNSLEKEIAAMPSVKSITPFITQTAVISYKEEIEGITAKAMPNNIPNTFLVAGRNIQQNDSGISTEIVISKELATKLNIPLGADIRLYFLTGSSVLQRKLKLVGLFHSGIEDYDQQFVMIDLKLMNQLIQNNQLIEGYTVTLKKEMDPAIAAYTIQSKLPANHIASTIDNYYPQIFDWINVQNVNRNVTITIMLIIAIVNLLTCLFILMLEKINMIGTLSALGASHNLLRKVFLYQASFISVIGIGIGAIIGIGLSLLQQYFGLITLDESAYFMNVLPIHIKPLQVLVILLGTALVSYLSFLMPTLWIKKISPAQSIRFD